MEKSNRFSDIQGFILRADIGLGGTGNAQIGVFFDVESEDGDHYYRMFDGTFVNFDFGPLDPLQARQYARLIELLLAYLEDTGCDSLNDLVGMPVDIRLDQGEAVCFRFTESPRPWPRKYR